MNMPSFPPSANLRRIFQHGPLLSSTALPAPTLRGVMASFTEVKGVEAVLGNVVVRITNNRHVGIVNESG